MSNILILKRELKNTELIPNKLELLLEDLCSLKLFSVKCHKYKRKRSYFLHYSTITNQLLLLHTCRYQRKKSNNQ